MLLQQTILFCQGGRSWLASLGGLEGYALCALLFVAIVLQLITLQHFVDYVFNLGMQVRATVVAVVYTKAIALSRSARRQLSSGKLMQLQSKEADKLETFILFAHNLWSAPLNATWICLLLLHLLGPPALVSRAAPCG